MATKQTTKNKSSSSKSGKSSRSSSRNKSSRPSRRPSRRKRKLQPVNEPLPAKAMQSFILVMGVVLLLGAVFGFRWGLGIVGLLILGSAFPPARATIDKWLVGQAKGDEANQAAMLRMVAGVAVILVAILALG